MPIEFKTEKVNTDDPVVNLQRKLRGLGIGFNSIGPVKSGPIVSAIPITLDASTPLNKLMSKAEDLALALGVESIDVRRVGKEVVVFVPNSERSTINFMDALVWYLKDETVQAMDIPILLGMDVDGNKSVIELTKQPHLLISGSTGSGKSIFEANILASLAMLKSVYELEIYLVDTKMLDLPLFEKLPHVQRVAREVEDFYELITDLHSIVNTRNRLFSKVGARNINEYNSAIDNKQHKLPHILLMIDELADLIDKDKEIRSSTKNHTEPKVLDSLRKLLQICRAAGVHVIACTQRTSGDIVSGITKVNFPARIALKLPTKKDSEYILDEGGAENLLGRGDMLVKETDSDSPKRYHGPFVKLEDIRAVINQMDMIKQSMGLEG